MELAQSHHHHTTPCSGCPACREDYAAMLNESAETASRRLSAHTRTMMRTAAAAEFRVSQPRHVVRKTESEWRDDFGLLVQGYGSVVTHTPDPYAKATSAAPELPCPDMDRNYDPHGTPPDPYAIALAIEQVKKENQ